MMARKRVYDDICHLLSITNVIALQLSHGDRKSEQCFSRWSIFTHLPSKFYYQSLVIARMKIGSAERIDIKYYIFILTILVVQKTKYV